MSVEGKNNKRSFPNLSKDASITSKQDDRDSESDIRDEPRKKIKTETESAEPSVQGSNIKDDQEDEGVLENENEGESEKDDGESVDSIEQQKNTFRFEKPKSWELQEVRIANVWDFMPDVVIHKWVKVRETEPVVFHRSSEKPRLYKCEQPDCGKVFTDSASLKKHQMVHGEKLFVCTYEGCGKKFLDKSKLRRHQLVHTGEKPHKCTICGKLFSLDFNLRTHMRTHTGEKPYICRFPGCSKRFTQSSNLSAHEKIHLSKDLNQKGPGGKPEGSVEGDVSTIS